MDPAKVESARKTFLQFNPEFKSFAEPGKHLEKWELDYKREASRKTHEILGPYVEGQQFGSDEEAHTVLSEVVGLTNFLNWRDTQFLEQKFFVGEEDWAEYANMLTACLRKLESGGWEDELKRILDWLAEWDCVARLTKLFPTYFLFLWDPVNHIAIKSQFFDKFLDRIGEEKLGSGVSLTVQSYLRICDVCQQVREALADWRPKDNIDIHSFAWVVSDGWGKDAKQAIQHFKEWQADTEAENEEGETPVQRLDMPLNQILAGPPGTGKTYCLLTEYVGVFEDDESPRYDFVTFHQSYSYEDFVEGIKPVMVGSEPGTQSDQISYTVEPGVFRRIVQRAIAHPEHSYALFIDEINRANISNVFGELITLIEPDKRMRYDVESKEWCDGVRVKLPYTHSAQPDEPLFGVPDNLYLIGTMNTADRSIALMDLALRRRFTFVEVMPDADLLAKSPGPVATRGGTLQLDKMLDKMNQRIEYLYDRDHTIGHSYFMRVRNLEDLDAVFRRQVLPLLQEYFYGDWEKIQLVLGDLLNATDSDGRPRCHQNAIVSHVVQSAARVLGLSDEAYQDRRSYEVSEEFSADSFRKIYETVQQ